MTKIYRTIDDLDFDDEYDSKIEEPIEPQIEEPIEEISKICFPIFDINGGLGTGFLITGEGLFLSAAHNFRDRIEDCFIECYAFYNGKKYEIELKEKGYNYDHKNMVDYYYGKLVDFEEKVDINFLLTDSQELKYGTQLNIFGFQSNYTSLFPMVCNGHTIYCHKKEITYTSYEEYDSQGLNIKSDRLRYLKMEEHYTKAEGISGGPVYLGKKIYGIFLGLSFWPYENIKIIIQGYH